LGRVQLEDVDLAGCDTHSESSINSDLANGSDSNRRSQFMSISSCDSYWTLAGSCQLTKGVQYTCCTSTL
jgi:hypothetical protein